MISDHQDMALFCYPKPLTGNEPNELYNELQLYNMGVRLLYNLLLNHCKYHFKCSYFQDS